VKCCFSTKMSLHSLYCVIMFFFSSRRRHTRSDRDWSSDVCSSDLYKPRDLAGRGLDQCQAEIARLVLETVEVTRNAARRRRGDRSEERRVGKECGFWCARAH